MRSHLLPVATALILGASLAGADAWSGELIVPLRVRASSNDGGDQPDASFHVDTLRLGAVHYDRTTGSNLPYGLMGFYGHHARCVSAAQTDLTTRAYYPAHEYYRSEPPEHPKHRGMWLSAENDHQDAWVEFELPAETTLGTLLVWNWNDGPEVGRRVKHLTIQTSTRTTTGGKLGTVVYDVTHATITLPNLGHIQARTPDLLFTFPPGTRSRYVRLTDMDNFGPHRRLGLAEVFLVAAGGPDGVRAAAPAGVKPEADGREPNWQLFLDDHAITRSTGFRRVLHHPRPRGVVLVPDQPWETFGVTPFYVGPRQGGGYECYYQTLWWEPGGRSVNQMCYAISTDGIRWEKPVLNMVEGPTETSPQPGFPLGVSGGPLSRANNIIPCGHPRDMFRHGNVVDPARRYAIGLEFRRGQRIGFCQRLPDFINDPNWREGIVDSGGFKPSHYNALEFWDDLHDEWVSMRQAPNPPPVRCGGRYASADLNKWRLDHFIYPDAHDSTDPRYFDEVYGVMGVHQEGVVLGYLHWFIGDRTHANAELYEDGHNRPAAEEGLIGKSVSKGTMEERIAISRDGGKTWDRTVSRQAWIPHGTEQHSLDRLVRVDCPPLRMGDEDWFYASIYDGDHAGARYYHDQRRSVIRGALYVQKHNRYVSLTAGNTPQILITRPIEVTGPWLQLNVDASRGEVRVGIGIDKVIPHKTGAWEFEAVLPHFMVEDRWERSHLEPGLHVNDCLPIREDCIEHNVRWKGEGLDRLIGKTVRLYIMVRDADLYGFRFH